VVGNRRSIRWFKTWETVPKETVQRILEAVRLTTCPGNLEPWRAIVVYRDELDDDTREELLKADNWQGAHVQAPVWIYFYGDPNNTQKECFIKNTNNLIEWGALPTAYGWNRETIKAAITEGVETPEGMAGIHELIGGLTPELMAWVAYSETVGACCQATLATVNEGLGACLHMVAKPSAQERVKEILGVPARCVPVWTLLVGHPAESPDGGGQRKREPWDEHFFLGKFGQPFPRDEAVVADLTEKGMIQPQAPLPGRFEELRFLSRMYGYPED
jgi:nitroreductase